MIHELLLEGSKTSIVLLHCPAETSNSTGAASVMGSNLSPSALVNLTSQMFWSPALPAMLLSSNLNCGRAAINEFAPSELGGRRQYSSPLTRPADTPPSGSEK